MKSCVFFSIDELANFVITDSAEETNTFIYNYWRMLFFLI